MFTKPRIQTSFYRRICDVMCAFLVILYVLFDVFDLDRSDACRITLNGHRSAMVGEADGDFRSDDLLELSIARPAPLVASASVGPTLSHQTIHLLLPLALSARSHGERGCHSETDGSGAPPDH